MNALLVNTGLDWAVQIGAVLIMILILGVYLKTKERD